MAICKYLTMCAEANVIYPPHVTHSKLHGTLHVLH